MKENGIYKCKFGDCDVSDSFFDSLRQDYSGFNDWFNRKVDEDVVVIYHDDSLEGFLYLKCDEKEEIITNNKKLPKISRVKIGTFKTTDKIQGRRYGEGLLGLALWKWANSESDEIYVTTYPKQTDLIKMLELYGFKNNGVINNSNGELLFIKSKKELDYSTPKKSFPFVSPNANGKIFLFDADYHDTMFPYSELQGVNFDLKDLDVKNGMSKMYVTNDFKLRDQCNVNDFGLIYRKTKEGQARFKSCITGICTIEQIIPIKRNNFGKVKVYYSFEDFRKLLGNKTVLTDLELKKYYNKKNVTAIQIMYNYSFGAGNNVNMHTLDNNGFWDADAYPTVFNYSVSDLESIMRLRRVDDVQNIIID